ncbi:MAG: DUF6364 family protein [Prevotella sp.]
METTSINLDKGIVSRALQVTKAKGMELTDVIEDFLITFVTGYSEKENVKYPDVVLSLLGKGEAVDNDDINGRKAYYEHLTVKHK